MRGEEEQEPLALSTENKMPKIMTSQEFSDLLTCSKCGGLPGFDCECSKPIQKAKYMGKWPWKPGPGLTRVRNA